MITIDQPRIENTGGKVYLKSYINDEGENRSLDLWYAVDQEYGSYLVKETADAFLVPMLLRAVVSGQSIKVNAPLSEQLFHNVNNSVLYALKTAWNQAPESFKRVRTHKELNRDIALNGGGIFDLGVKCQKTIAVDFGGKGVATGCSLGVDSFSVIKKYLLDNKDLPSYRLTHFACFNVGAFGTYNTDDTRNTFLRAVESTKAFAKELNMPVVSVDSNVHEFYPELDFNWSHTFLNMGCALSLQKLWKRYLYASSVDLSRFEFNIAFSGHYEPFLLPHLSTESTGLLAVDANMSRSDKVEYIMNEKIVQENLNVCLKEQFSNNGTSDYDDNGKLNCGHCSKCLRTMLQLDIYGVLDKYSGIFNLKDWEAIKPKYLFKVVSEKETNMMFNDLASTITDDYVDTRNLYKQVQMLKAKQQIISIIRKIIHPLK